MTPKLGVVTHAYRPNNQAAETEDLSSIVTPYLKRIPNIPLLHQRGHMVTCPWAWPHWLYLLRLILPVVRPPLQPPAS